MNRCGALLVFTWNPPALNVGRKSRIISMLTGGTDADIMNDDTTDKIAMLNEMHPMNPDERRDYLEYAINKKNNKNFETSPLTSRSIQYDGWNSTEWFETGIHGDDVKREVHGSRVGSMWIYLISWTIIAAFFFALILLLVSSSSDSTEIIASFAFIWIIGYCIALVYTRAMGRNKYDYTNAHAYDDMNAIINSIPEIERIGYDYDSISNNKENYITALNEYLVSMIVFNDSMKPNQYVLAGMEKDSSDALDYLRDNYYDFEYHSHDYAKPIILETLNNKFRFLYPDDSTDVNGVMERIPDYHIRYHNATGIAYMADSFNDMDANGKPDDNYMILDNASNCSHDGKYTI